MKIANVAIGYIHGDNEAPHTSLQMSILRMVQEESGQVPVLAVRGGPKVDDSRNELFRTWLTETTCDRLLMVDTDTIVPSDSIKRLRAHNKDLIGGLYFQAAYRSFVKPCIAVASEHEGRAYIEPYWNYPVNQLCKVEGLGGGFMMISRRLGMEMWDARGRDNPMPWFAHGMHNGRVIGEDVAFCLTALKIGYQPWCDTSLIADHMKLLGVNDTDYVRSLSSERHPVYNRRDDVPIYQRLTSGNPSLNGDRPGDEGPSEERRPRLVDYSPSG